MVVPESGLPSAAKPSKSNKSRIWINSGVFIKNLSFGAITVVNRDFLKQFLPI